MKITVSIPYYNRADLVMETIRPLMNEDRVDEIILCDDCSPEDDFDKLLRNTEGMDKIKIVRNIKNFHNQHNKRNALSFAKNEWVLLLDNDNVAQQDFFDKLFALDYWEPDTIYHPAFAAPTFDYRQFNDETFTKKNVRHFAHHPIFMTLLNTNNYLVNRDEYLRKYRYDKTVRGADGIFFMYNWLNEGNKIYIVPDMQYFHRVHDGSEFLRERDSNMNLIYHWINEVKKL
jgi:glycosyltransferase involved in cell wall biosynthesis